MQILTEYNAPYIISSVSAPVVPKFNWIFSGEMQDFKLEKITYLEETTGSAIEVMINQFRFIIPASWHIMICDDETSIVDTIPIANCSTSDFDALLMCSTSSTPVRDKIRVLDLHLNQSLAHVSIMKGTMLCHPIGPINDNRPNDIYNCMIGPYDIHKYISDVSITSLFI